MTRYAAFLRGVSPMNLKMPALASVLRDCGFSNVRTLLSSGNVVFDGRATRQDAIEHRIEAALHAQLGRAFRTFVRDSDALAQIVARTAFAHPEGTKQIVVFLRNGPPQALLLPLEKRGCALLEVVGTEAYGYYTPGNQASAFMALLERTFGADFTTRTAGTVGKCADAQALQAGSRQA